MLHTSRKVSSRALILALVGLMVTSVILGAMVFPLRTMADPIADADQTPSDHSLRIEKVTQTTRIDTPTLTINDTEWNDATFTHISASMHPATMHRSAIAQTGLLFNGSFSETGYTGYMLLLSCENGTSTLSLLFVDGEQMDADNYKPGALGTTRSDEVLLTTEFDDVITPDLNIDIKRDSATGVFTIYVEGREVALVPNPRSNGEELCLFTSAADMTTGSGVSADVNTVEKEISIVSTLPVDREDSSWMVGIDRTGQLKNTGAAQAHTSISRVAAPEYGAHIITEKYQKFHSDFGDALPRESVLRVLGGKNDIAHYSPDSSALQSITDGAGKLWRYYAYSVDGGEIIVGAPPLGLSGDDYLIDEVSSDHEIVFYFVENVDINVTFRLLGDETGPDLTESIKTSAPAMNPYTMLQSYLTPIVNETGTLSYADRYSLDGGITWLDGTPQAPTFTTEEMAQPTDAKHIVLLFSARPIVTVTYREYASVQSLLDSTGAAHQIYQLDGDGPTHTFNAMSNKEIADTVASGATSILGVAYPTYRGWQLDEGPIHLDQAPPVFDTLVGGEQITLYFSTHYSITENFHANDAFDAQSLVGATVLRDPVVTEVEGGATFTGSAPGTNPPPNFFAQGAEWRYIGWVIDRGDPDFSKIASSDYDAMVALCQGQKPPVIDPVTSNDISITYIYAPLQAANKLTVTERYREYEKTEHFLAPNQHREVKAGGELIADPIDASGFGDGWAYVGYQIDGGALIDDALPLGVILSPIDQAHTITYLYERNSRDAISSIDATKTVEGFNDSIDEMFRFALVDGNGNIVDLTVNDASNITFDLPFADEGTAEYTVIELGLASDPAPAIGSAAPATSEPKHGWTFDSTVWPVAVEIVAQDQDLIATVTYPDGEITFNNIYEGTLPAGPKIDLAVSKSLVDANGKAVGAGKEFAIVIYNAEKQPIDRFVITAGGAPTVIGNLAAGSTIYLAEEGGLGFRTQGFDVQAGEQSSSVEANAVKIEVPVTETDMTVKVTVRNIATNVNQIPGTVKPLPATGDIISTATIAKIAVALGLSLVFRWISSRSKKNAVNI